MRHSIAPTGNGDGQQTAALRRMSADQLLSLGTRQVVYLRAGTCGDEKLFVLFGADGVPLATVDEVEAAVEMAAECGLQLIAVH